jgi:SAM-dependent methyltransferase
MTKRSAFLQRGHSTAHDNTVVYRLSKVHSHIKVEGRWLDCGCAEGGYTSEIVRTGAEYVVGVDIELARVSDAGDQNLRDAAWAMARSESLPFASGAFDGVFLNEVLEHVESETSTLREIHRVLAADGVLVVMSPNRWFPFEGHGMSTGWFNVPFPVPLVTWLPQRLFRRYMTARNYWPRELGAVVEQGGFTVEVVDFVFPMFERWRWLPGVVERRYLKLVPRLERIPGLRRLGGVSTLLIARLAKPVGDTAPTR